MNASGAKQGVTPAGLAWDQGTPASQRFGDVYYSRGEGLAEKRHVFLAGCGLPDAWRGRETFTICELGFGTGLSFLATARQWSQTAAPHARLNYLAVEAHPLTPEDLRRSLAPWDEIAREAGALLKIYPAPSPGFHRLHLGGGISLTLLCGDAAAMLAQAGTAVDAWYLDGFAPSKNPEMWSGEVFRELARLSRPGARLATYSAAGQVRRGLQDAGFAVELTAGFGRKREMIQARYAGGARKSPAPWFAPAAPVARGRAAIVGGGIAGTAAAAALTRRGWTCTLVERRAALAGAASGTPAGVAMPRLTAGRAIDGRIHAAAWGYATRSWAEFPYYAPCGVLQLATDAAEAERLGAVADSGILPALAVLSRDSASAAAGCTLPVSALLFPTGGRIDTRALCAAQASGTNVLSRRDVTAIERAADGWRLLERGAVICEADVVVLANAGAAAAFPAGAWLPLAARQGQITAAAPSLETARLRCVLAYGGTITPAQEGLHHVGATFSGPVPGAAEDAVSAADDARNLAQLGHVLPELARGLTPAASWAGVRWTTSDHLPLVGPLADAAAFARDFAPLRHGQHWVDYPPAVYEPALYIMAGFGSHGLALAPLCAELLACHITGEPLPLEQDLVAALHPSRFLLRDLKRPK